uniref:peptidylprolyl isomerase n=1 Tax=Noctiluca scintillans TaxID=2966 RepID=A0A7S1AYB5_NOCSC
MAQAHLLSAFIKLVVLMTRSASVLHVSLVILLADTFTVFADVNSNSSEFQRIRKANTTFRILKEGRNTSAKVFDGDVVTCDSEGTLVSSGKIFWDLKNFRYTAGGTVIPGWDHGAKGMKKGEIREILVPASEGYGEAGFPAMGVPPNEDLRYVLKVLKIQEKDGIRKKKPRTPPTLAADLLKRAKDVEL